jgi:choline-sulfatase
MGALAFIACGGDELDPTTGKRRGHGGRGVLMIVIDGVRADHMGYTGYDRDTTPVIDSLAGQGVAFTQAFSSAPELIASHASLLTGCDPVVARQPLPQDQGALSLGRRWRIPAPAPSLAAEFLAQGYATLALSDSSWLASDYGFDRGFERFEDFRGGQMFDDGDFGAAELGRALLDWIRSLDSERDWFAYININDLERAMRHAEGHWQTYFQPRPELDEIPPVSDGKHTFFAIPRGHWPGGQRTTGEYEACYDGFLRQLDWKLGRLVGVLERIGRLDQTTICIVGTYGIGFGEAGLYLDTGTLADVDLGVPLVIKYPASSKLTRGLRYEGLASTIDVGATLLDLAGIELPSGLHGRSHLPALAGADSPPVNDLVYSMGGLSEGFAVHDARYSYQSIIPAVRGDGDLLASWYGTAKPERRPRRRYLRDRLSDSGPGDLGPSAAEPEVAERLHAAGEDWYTWIGYARVALHDPPWLEEELPPEIKAQLLERGLVPAPTP